MKDVTKVMIRNFKIMKKGYDFAGYSVDRIQSLSFHHLIIPHRECKKMNIGDGYSYWNGAILVQNTSHDYLHLIEHIDYDMFLAITSELIDENVKGYLDVENIRRIHDIMNCFEKEHDSDKNKKGNILIKRKYKQRNKF